MADPVKNYPSVFGHSVVLQKNPYILPNLVCTGVVLLGLIVGFLFLEETHQDKRDRHDFGLVLGRHLLRCIPWIGKSLCENGATEEARRVVTDEKGDYRPIPASPQLTATVAMGTDDSAIPVSEKTAEVDLLHQQTEPKVSFYKSLTKQIKLIIVSYGLLAL